ncbi:MAG: LysR family transcriptional regulator [Nonomuraea sp.]|nr:LysR family transcriptional regulator [Nonomuraea sp.]
MDLDLRHLRMVCAIAETGSVTKAAARLGLSQPAITSQLHKFEELVGGDLFVRTRSGAEPTALGRQVVSRARIVLHEIDALVDDLQANSAATGELRVGANHFSCAASIVDRVGDLVPEREVSLHIEPSSALLADGLSHGWLDVAMMGMLEGSEIAMHAPVTTRTLVTRYPIFVALSAAHALAGRDSVRLEELAAERWISPPGADDGSLASLRAACRAAGFEPDIRYDAPSGAGRHLVAAGHGIRLVDPAWPPPDGTVALPLTGEPQMARLVMAWRRDRVNGGAAGVIYQGLAKAFLDHVDDNPAFRQWWDGHPETHPVL